MTRKKPETLVITGGDIAEACGFALDPLACKSCGGCGWFTSVGPDPHGALYERGRRTKVRVPHQVGPHA